MVSFIILLILLCLAYFIPSANATQTLTLSPVEYGCLSNFGSGTSEMLVWFDSGFKQICYFTFNMREISYGSSINSVVFQVKTKFALTPAWVSAFSFPFLWTNFSWANYILCKRAANDRNFVATNLVTTNEVWYSYQFSTLLADSLKTSLETGVLTIELESSLFGVDQSSSIILYDDAKLIINYTPDIAAPTLGNIRIQPNQPTPNDNVKVSVSVTDDRSGVKEACLYYSINNAGWNKVLMISKDSIYEVTFPKHSEGTTVQYYFEVFDNAHNRAQSGVYSYTVRSNIPIYYYLLLVIGGVIAIVLAFITIRKGVFSKKVKKQGSLLSSLARKHLKIK